MKSSHGLPIKLNWGKSDMVSRQANAPLTVIVPVYNEAENFPPLWSQVTRSIHSELTVLIVYDFEGDTTVPVVRSLIDAGESRLRLVRNHFGRGVVGALRSGFQQAAPGPVLVVMADLCDDLSRVDEMLARYCQGYDIVVGSRYMPGGGVLGGPWFKRLLSRLAGISLHSFRGLPTHDATNAFKLYDRDILNVLNIESTGGFAINLEITVKAFLAGYRITEIPTVWRDRTNGESRFRLWNWLPQYLRWYFHAFRPVRARAAAKTILSPNPNVAAKSWNHAADD
jgi:glycosyltransferase involved in cell wall biosynthesis